MIMIMRYAVIGIIVGTVIVLMNAYNIYNKTYTIELTYLHETNLPETPIDETVALHEN